LKLMANHRFCSRSGWETLPFAITLTSCPATCGSLGSTTCLQQGQDVISSGRTKSAENANKQPKQHAINRWQILSSSISEQKMVEKAGSSRRWVAAAGAHPLAGSLL